jgi:hypothetical protein
MAPTYVHRERVRDYALQRATPLPERLREALGGS